MAIIVYPYRLIDLVRSWRMRLVGGLVCLLLVEVLLVFTQRLAAPPAQASIPSGGNVGIGVPCLRAPAPDQFMVTTFGNTLVDVDPTAPHGGKASPDFPVLRLITPSGEQDVGARLADLGAVYGMAWDDGAISGTPRLFLGAYTRHTSGYGPGGPGAIYTFDPATRVVRHVATVDAGANGHGGTHDANVRNDVSRTGLGDLDISPDGRRLYVMNLHTKTIAVFDITGATPVRQADIALNLTGLIQTTRSPSRRADLYAFGMGFRPTHQVGDPATHETDEIVSVGVIDTRARWSGVPWYGPQWEVDALPFAHVIEVNLTKGTQRLTVSQPLGERIDVSGQCFHIRTLGEGARTMWHTWTDTPTGITLDRVGHQIIHPTPLLTDIVFSADGETMFLGLRDRTGDQYFSRNPPGGERSVIAQGDVLTYRRTGDVWTLLTTTGVTGQISWDMLLDNAHDGTTEYTENMLGGLATRLTQIGGGASLTLADDVLATSLVGSSTAGVRWYPTSGGTPTHEVRTMHGAGKASGLGDVEELCTSAIVGDRVWRDQNGNGIQDTGEPGIDGVQVDLTTRSGQLLASATTASGGIFRFAIPPNRDDLILRLHPTNFRIGHALEGLILAPQDMGSDDQRDSDAHEIAKAIDLPAQWRDHQIMTFAFGLMDPLLAQGKIGDVVWRDHDGDGRQDTGEPGINGITVHLERCDIDTVDCAGGTWVRVDSRTTHTQFGQDGWYLFDILPPGYVRVHFDVPSGATAAPRDVGRDDADSDADASTGWRTPTICTVSGNNPDPSCQPDQRTWDLGLVDDMHVTLRLSTMGLSEITSGSRLTPLIGRTVAFQSSGRTTNRQTDANRQITGSWATMSNGGQPLDVTPGIPTGTILQRVTHDCAGATVDLTAGAVRGTRESCDLTFHYVLNPVISAEALARTSTGGLTDLATVPITLKGDTTSNTNTSGDVTFTFTADQIRAMVPQASWTLTAPPTFGALRRTSSSPLTISPVQTSSGHRFIYEAPIQITLITTGMDGSETGRRPNTSMTFINGSRTTTRTTDSSGQMTTQWIDTGDPTGTLTIIPASDASSVIHQITHTCGAGTTTDLTTGRITIPASSVAATATPGCAITVRSVPRPQIGVSVVGERTDGTRPLPNVPIRLLTSTGSQIATASSDSNGQMTFTLTDAQVRSLIGAASSFWQIHAPPQVGALDLRNATLTSRRQGTAPNHWLRLDPVQSSSDNQFVYGAEIEVHVVEHGTDGAFLRDLTTYRVDFIDRDDGGSTTRQTNGSGRIALRWLDVVDPGHNLEIRPNRPDVTDPASRFLWRVDASAGCGAGSSDLDAVWYRPTTGDSCDVTVVFVPKPIIAVQTVGRYADGTPMGACPSGYAAPAGTCPIPFLDVSWTRDGTPTSVIQSGRTARDGTFTFDLTTDDEIRAFRSQMPLTAAGLYAQETVTTSWNPGTPVGILVEARPGTHATAQSGPVHLRLSPVRDSPGNVFVYAVSPPAPPDATQDVRLWMHSRFDTAPGPQVYLSSSQDITWPAGEILDYTPHVTVTLHGQSPFPDHFAFASRTVSWSYVNAVVTGRDRLATAADDLNRSDCRERDAPIDPADAQGLDGCAYVYLNMVQPLPDDLIYQGHIFFAANQLIALEPDVYAYQLAALEATRLHLQVKSFITVDYVHTRPDGIQEVESETRPQVDTGIFRIGLVVPRTVR